MAGGYDIGASLSGSASSGASLSGATDFAGGGNYGGVSNGPGSVVFGSPGNPTPGQNLLIVVAVITGAVILFTLVSHIFKGGR